MIGTSQVNGIHALLSLNCVRQNSEAVAGVNHAVPAVRIGNLKEAGRASMLTDLGMHA